MRHRDRLVKFRFTRASAALTHLPAFNRICRQLEDRTSERGAVSDFNHPAALVPGNESGNLAILGTDKDGWSTGGTDAVELAGYNDAFEI